MKARIELPPEQEAWAKRAKKNPRNRGIGIDEIRLRLLEKGGCCEWSETPLRFAAEDGKAVEPMENAKAKPCHPLYATLEHSEPSSLSHGFEIVCYHLNDIKGQLPHDCFVELKISPSWKRRMMKWKKQAELDPNNITALLAVLNSSPL